MNALVVVAHDDDAVLWMGGAIRRLRDWDWHIISMCNACDEVRKTYFERVCGSLGARAAALDFADYPDQSLELRPNRLDEMKASLLQATHGVVYDYIFTHSRDPNGEYSFHPNHSEVWQVVSSLVAEAKLAASKSTLAYFCYYPIYGVPGLGTVARKDAKYYYQLSYSELAFKARLIGSHMPAIVEDLERVLGAPCPNPEAFEGDGLGLPCPFIGR